MCTAFVHTVQSACHEGSCRCCLLIAILSTEIQPELKLLKFCSCKQTKISFDALNTLFDVGHLGNDVNFSVEISYVPWNYHMITTGSMWVIIWQNFFSPSGSTLRLVESLKGSTQNLPEYKMCWSRSLKVCHAASFLKGAQWTSMSKWHSASGW